MSGASAKLLIHRGGFLPLNIARPDADIAPFNRNPQIECLNAELYDRLEATQR